MWNAWKHRARQFRQLTFALYLACRDPRTPWLARVVAIIVVGYAFSPVDLIPDFIPVLGIVDDLILLPLGIALAIRLMPDRVWQDAQAAAAATLATGKPVNRVAGAIVVMIWLAIALAGGYLAFRLMTSTS